MTRIRYAGWLSDRSCNRPGMPFGKIDYGAGDQDENGLGVGRRVFSSTHIVIGGE